MAYEKTFLLSKNKELCCGCQVCKITCSKNAITMKSDKKGFVYPTINSKLCIKCGICTKVCQYSYEIAENTEPQDFFAAKVKDENELLSVSSGGVGAVIARYAITSGGVCVGAVYDSDFSVKHKIIKDLQGVEALKTSKYSQSDISSCLPQIKDLLNGGTNVVFIGTPCQVASLKKYLNRPYDNLVLCDLICGGVPSPLIFKKFISDLSKQYNSKIVKINMKDKTFGWLTPTILIEFENGQIYKKKLYDTAFGQLFLRQITVRESCQNCIYSSLNREGDITIGDYWSLKKYYPNKFDNNGMSTIIINTSKGKYFWNEINCSLDTFKVSQEESMQNRLCRNKTSVNKGDIQSFWKKYSPDIPLQKIFDTVFSKKNVSVTLWEKIKYRLFK